MKIFEVKLWSLVRWPVGLQDRDLIKGIGVLIKEPWESYLTPSPIWGNNEKKAIMNQKVGSYQAQNVPTTWFWTSQPLCKNISDDASSSLWNLSFRLTWSVHMDKLRLFLSPWLPKSRETILGSLRSYLPVLCVNQEIHGS